MLAIHAVWHLGRNKIKDCCEALLNVEGPEEAAERRKELIGKMKLREVDIPVPAVRGESLQPWRRELEEALLCL